ncbi:hyoscyamine 6-dioxygenase-like [Rutidosis leptorrhynchoides]|uniref:hyoscyamine 6-dioxygenase-like n=1 Tax=Rutidosis leptorrhynchoides TaxID=125765 RepID=UPI003A98FEEF
METLVSSWSKTCIKVPENYILPESQRAGSDEIHACKSFPLIDLSGNQSKAIQEILYACQEFGFFQVINHGVSEDLIDDTIKVIEEFFDLPNEEKAQLFSTDQNKACRLYTSSYNYNTEKVHFWRDGLRHPVHPLDEWVHLWPEKPTNYRDVVGKYSLELRKLTLRILELICEGLGIEAGYFEGDLSKNHVLSINHYPPCPDPSLTMGIPKHADANLITVLFQGNISGLQVLKNGQWLGVEPVPHAFVVNIGNQLEVISNGKLRSAEHRGVTNSKVSRTTIGSFILPNHETIIKPAKTMIESVPLYRPFKYKEFSKLYVDTFGDTDAVMEAFKIKT